MPIRSVAAAGSLRRLLRGLLAWAMTALFLLLLASATLAGTGTGSGILGYVSSAVSFLSALAAGLLGTDRKRGRLLLQGLAVALLLILVLLTAGFLASERQLNQSGVLSVVSFTVAGALLGSVISGQSGASGRKRSRGKLRVARKG